MPHKSLSEQGQSALVQVTACRLAGTKPLPEPMLAYCQLDPEEQTSMKFKIKTYNFSFMKMHLKMLSAKWQPFCPGGDESSMIWWDVNSLRPSDAIWPHRSGSTLAQVMAFCPTTPSHYLNQCWLIISKVLWHSSEGNFIRDTSATIH